MKNKMTQLQQAISVGSMIGSILAQYDKKERSRTLKDIDEMINNSMTRYAYINIGNIRAKNHQFIEAIKISDSIWRKTVNYFTERNISIEAVSTVMRLHYLYDEPLEKHFGITERMIEKFAGELNHTYTESESNAYDFADYILDELAHHTGVKRKSLSALKGKVKAKHNLNKMDAILEGQE